MDVVGTFKHSMELVKWWTMKFIFENGDDVLTPSEPKTLNLNIEELKVYFPLIVDNKHLFEFLDLIDQNGKEESRSWCWH